MQKAEISSHMEFFEKTPGWAKVFRLLATIGFLGLIFQVFKKFGGSEVSIAAFGGFAAILVFAMVVKYSIRGKIILDNQQKKIFHQVEIFSSKHSSEVCRSSEIHAIGVSSSTSFLNAKSGLHGALDNSTVKSSYFWAVGLTSTGKTIRLSDDSGNSAMINSQAEKMAEAIGCAFCRGHENTRINPQKLANGRWRFEAEDFDPVARQNYFMVAIIAFLAIAALVAKLTGN